MSRFNWIRRLFASQGTAAGRRPVSLRLLPLEDRLTPAAPFPEFVDPNPAPGNNFGETVITIGGNVLITSPGDDANGTDTGALYLFNGATGALISTLRGSTTGDFQNASVRSLAGSIRGIVLVTPNWDNGTVANAGAVTFINQTTGLSGVISAANSLVGTSKDDGVSMSMTELRNGNFLVSAPNWDNGSVVDAGAVTFIQGTGFTGVISAANSLVGTSKNDRVGFDVRRIDAGSGGGFAPRGDYLVVIPGWDDGSVVDVGAVTFGNGTTGLTGVVSAANSLVGSTAGDRVGQSVRTGDSLSKVYVVSSSSWDNGSVADAGAVTFASNETGITGVVSAANSLVGSTAGDGTGMTAFSLDGGNYVVARPGWDNGSVVNVGAATFVNTTTGVSVTGVVSAANSLVGTTAGDLNGMRANNVGISGYVLQSPNWDNGSAVDAGAVTFSNIATAITGVISASNSLVGSTTGDKVGQNVFFDSVSRFFGSPGYAVITERWDNGSVVDVGAVTFASGVSGITGVVSTANSFIGSTAGDGIGLDVDFGNGASAAIVSPRWDNGSVVDVGAVTFVTLATGLTGVISAANSLVGSTAGDGIGMSVTVPTTGFDLIIESPGWDNGSVVDAGAVTFVVNAGLTGVISAANSLVGSSTGDLDNVSFYRFVGEAATVVISPSWDSGAAVNAGAATYVRHATGINGVISAANSLVGSTAGDGVEMSVSEVISGDGYVVIRPRWDNGSVADAGAVTYGNVTTGISGVVTAANSLVGSTAGDGIGMFVTTLPEGNYAVGSPGWDNGSVVDAGAVTFVTAGVGPVGPITTQNSMVGSSANSGLKSVVRDFTNRTYYARFLTDGGGRVRLGDQVFLPPVSPPLPGSRVFLRAVGAGAGGGPHVRVFNADGSERFSFFAYDPAFAGGVSVATADVTGDGVDDIVTGAGAGGGPHVKVFDGVTGAEVFSFFAYDPAFTGGVSVAAGDVNGDGFADIVTGAGAGGGPHVRVFDGRTGGELASFFAYDPAFTGGVNVAVGDVNGDGRADIVTGAGAGGGPHVKVVNATGLGQTNADGTIADTALLANFMAFDLAFGGGVNVSAGDFDGDGLADVVVGAGAGGGPHVKVVSATGLSRTNADGGIAADALLADFFGYEEGFAGGVRVGVADGLPGGGSGLILGAGPGGGPRVRVLQTDGLSVVEDFFAAAPEFAGGVFLG